IQIVSVASPGEVVFSPIELAPALQVDALTRLGRVELSRGAFLNAAGNGGGTVVIRGGRLLVDNAFIFTDNLGEREGAGLGLDLQITGDALLTHNTVLTADSLGAGRARDIWLRAGSVHLEDGAEVSSSTWGPGQAGLVRVMATDTLTLAGTPPSSISAAA